MSGGGVLVVGAGSPVGRAFHAFLPVDGGWSIASPAAFRRAGWLP